MLTVPPRRLPWKDQFAHRGRIRSENVLLQEEQIHLRVSGIYRVRSASLERIDKEHANPRKACMEMGSPTYLDRAQIEALKKDSELHRENID
jgi:beta-xylosidase